MVVSMGVLMRVVKEVKGEVSSMVKAAKLLSWTQDCWVMCFLVMPMNSPP